MWVVIGFGIAQHSILNNTPAQHMQYTCHESEASACKLYFDSIPCWQAPEWWLIIRRLQAWILITLQPPITRIHESTGGMGMAIHSLSPLSIKSTLANHCHLWLMYVERVLLCFCHVTLQCSLHGSLQRCAWLASCVSEEACVSLPSW